MASSGLPTTRSAGQLRSRSTTSSGAGSSGSGSSNSGSTSVSGSRHTTSERRLEPVRDESREVSPTSSGELAPAASNRPPPDQPVLGDTWASQFCVLFKAMLYGFSPVSVEAAYLTWQEQVAVKWDSSIFWAYLVMLLGLVISNLKAVQGELQYPSTALAKQNGGRQLMHAIPLTLVPIKLLAFSSAWLMHRTSSAPQDTGPPAQGNERDDHTRARNLSGRTRLVALSFMLESAWWLGQAGYLAHHAAKALAPLHWGLLYYENPVKALLLQAPFRQLWPLLVSSSCAALPTQCAADPWPGCALRPLLALMMVMAASALGDLRFRWKYCNVKRQEAMARA